MQQAITTKQMIENSKVENYRIFASNGNPIRVANKVIFPTGKEMKFLDKLSKREALKQAESMLNKISQDGYHLI